MTRDKANNIIGIFFPPLRKIKETRNEIEKDKLLLNLIKTEGCDMCFNEVMRSKICSADMNNPDRTPIVQIPMIHRNLKLCKKHAQQLRDELYEILQQS